MNDNDMVAVTHYVTEVVAVDTDCQRCGEELSWHRGDGEITCSCGWATVYADGNPNLGTGTAAITSQSIPDGPPVWMPRSEVES